jgi:dihydrofolate reductase
MFPVVLENFFIKKSLCGQKLKTKLYLYSQENKYFYNKRGKEIWLVGGGKLITMLLNQDMIDEMIIIVIPDQPGFLWSKKK